MLIKLDNHLVSIDNGIINFLNSADEVEPYIPIVTKHDTIYKIEDIYSSVQKNERIIFITRHAERGSDTSIYGDLNANGIKQCTSLGKKLKNDNIDLSKTYIGGSHKYRAKNTAYQVTKGMGVNYSNDYNYITDTDGYDELMEINFFVDDNGESSGVTVERNAYYSYISDELYSGSNKVENHVNTKSQQLIDLMVNKAEEENADLCWFGTHDKVIIPLLAYVTDKKRPIHLERLNKDVSIKMQNPTTSAITGNWYTPLLSGVAFIINKNTKDIDIYPIESGI